jgi:hypothetical protein
MTPERRIEFWLERFAKNKDAPPKGWHSYLRAAWETGSVETWRAAYRLYLRSNAWTQKRRGVLRRVGGMCQLCKSEIRLHVHHVSYANVGREPMEDLRCLCRNCHQLRHLHGFKHQPIPRLPVIHK